MNQKFQFIGQASDQLPIQAVLNNKPQGPRLISIQPDHPLFLLILFMRNSADFSNMTSDEIDIILELSLSELDNLLNDALSKFKANDKIVLKGHQDTQTFIDAVELIQELMSARTRELGMSKINFLVSSIQLFLNFFSQIEKKIIIKNKKTKSNEAISDLTLSLSSGLAILYFNNGYYHQAELHCEKTMALLGKTNDQAQVAFSIQVTLVMVYFKFGHFDAGLRLIKGLPSKISDKKIFSEIESGLLLLIRFLKNNVLPASQDKKSLLALELCQANLSLIRLAIDKSALVRNKRMLEVHETMMKNSSFEKSKLSDLQKEVETDFLSAQKKYLEDFTLTMKNSTAIRKMVAKVKHHFLEHSLLLELKSPGHAKILPSVLRALGISVEMHASQIKVDLYRCSPEILAKACEKSLVLLEKEEQLVKMRADSNQKLAQTEIMLPEKSPLKSTTALQRTDSSVAAEKSSPKTTKPVSSKTKKPSVLSTQTIVNNYNSSNKVVLTEEPTEKPSTAYHWPKAGLTYQSTEGNEGNVKSLSHEDEGLTPNGLYFGYMPDYVIHDEHYQPGFAEKLNTGKIGKNAIRRITKEMQTIGAPDCFIFKIVVSSRNSRIYGWIEDVCIDEEGKQHFLVCFGLISDHKQKNLLKNPQKFKEKMLQKIQPITEKLPTDDRANNFFVSFTDIIYDESSKIPGQIKIPLQNFLNNFIRSYYILASELDDQQNLLLLSQLLKMNTLLLKLEHQLSVEEQLSVIEEILNVLSQLESNLYWRIVAPLTDIMKEAIDYYKMAAKPHLFSDEQLAEQSQISEPNHSEDQQVEQLLTQLNQISERAETDLNKFEKVESTENTIEAQKVEQKDRSANLTVTRAITN